MGQHHNLPPYTKRTQDTQNARNTGPSYSGSMLLSERSRGGSNPPGPTIMEAKSK
jgi:hypothetical protein